MRPSKPVRGLSSRPAVALDIDGVLLRGRSPIAGASRAVKRLQQHQVPFLLLTNGGGVNEKVKTDTIAQALDVELNPKRTILSHTPYRDLAPQYADDRVLVVGRLDSAAVAREYGFRGAVHTDELGARFPSMHPHTTYPSHLQHRSPPPLSVLQEEPPFRAAFIMADPHNWAQDMQILVDVLQSDGRPGIARHPGGGQGVPLFASNPDMLYAAEFPWPRFGQGAFLASLRMLFHEVTGEALHITQYGKPHRRTYDYAQRVLESMADGDLDHIYGVGDNPAADIRGARRAGWHSVLVRTGVFPAEGAENDEIDPADYVCRDVDHFVDQLLQEHGAAS
eukprot:gb/GECH01009712.1/.p1 GENE.gb/GECH01009712.1/~~gb/GECH01009712.1/.p1  ORF type:complete len:336 (+),score=70.98 gb/GECH01009712.1/:1-1008(+)